MRSTPKSTEAYRWLQLEKCLLAFGVEEMQRARVQPELDAVARTHGHPRIDSSRDLVTAHHPVQELVGAQPLHDIDLHLEGRGAVDHAVGYRLRAEPERALRCGDGLGQPELEAGSFRRSVGDGSGHEVHRQRADEAGDEQVRWEVVDLAWHAGLLQDA